MKSLQITTYDYPYLEEKVNELDVKYDDTLSINAYLLDIGIKWLGRGQYSLYVTLQINNKSLKLSAHSTDSELYDMENGEEKYTRIYDRVIDEDSWSIIQEFIEDNFTNN